MALWKPTRRTILRAGGLIAAPAIIGRAMAQVPLTGAGRGAPGGAPSTTTLDPANKSATLTLSAGNLVVTQSNVSNWYPIRSIASHSTGTYYAEFTNTTDITPPAMMIGICNSTFPFTPGNFLGGTADSMGLEDNGSVVGGTGTGVSFAQGDVISMEYNATTGNIRYRVNGGTYTSPITTSFGGQVVFAALALFTTNNVFTANFGGSAYAFSATAGNW